MNNSQKLGFKELKEHKMYLKKKIDFMNLSQTF